MTDMPPATPLFGQSPGEALLASLTESQQRAVEIIAQEFFNILGWPYFQWVEDKLDQESLDARSVLATFPTVGHPGGACYGAVSYDRLAGPMPDSDVRLIALGLHHVAGPLHRESQDLLRWFFLVLADLVGRRRGFAVRHSGRSFAISQASAKARSAPQAEAATQACSRFWSSGSSPPL